jgi:hypothetical protein
MAELTDRYVFVNASMTVPLDAYRIKIDLGPNNERVPHIVVEVIAASLSSSVLAVDTYIVKAEETALNSYSADFNGTTIASMAFNAVIDSKNVFNINGFTPKLLFGGQTRYLTLYLEDAESNRQQLGGIVPFSMLLKCSFPRVGAIQDAYRQEIPLPSRLL